MRLATKPAICLILKRFSLLLQNSIEVCSFFSDALSLNAPKNLPGL
jgi:hypothetical protein